MDENFERLITILLKKNLPAMVCVGTVNELSEDKQTCTVEREDAPTLYQVRLNAIIGKLENNVTIIPTVGSKVLCSLIDNDVNEAFVLSSEKPEEVNVTFGDTSLVINKDGVTINTGELGGLIKIEELKSQLEKLTARVDTIFDGLSKLAPDPPQAGSTSVTSGLKAIVSPVKEDFENIEDVKVKH